MRHNHIHQLGISLISAIFLLVVVASLLAYTLNISGIQRGTTNLNLKAARGLQAARSGIEWGAFHALTPISSINCAGIKTSVAFDIDTSDSMAFSVKVDCDKTDHTEGTINFETYSLTSTATHGSFGSLDYTSRTISASVSALPP